MGNRAIALLRRPAEAILHPVGAGRFVRDRLVRRGRTAFDLELPWLSYGAIDHLDLYLNRDMTVYEYGSGGSTLWFARRTGKVVSVEHDPEWAGRLQEKLDLTGLAPKVDLRLRDVCRDSRTSYEASPYAQALPDEPADVAVIDGPDRFPWTDLRISAFYMAEQRIKPGGMIVMDDSQDYDGLRYKTSARDVLTFTGYGPGRTSLTSTDIYLY